MKTTLISVGKEYKDPIRTEARLANRAEIHAILHENEVRLEPWLVRPGDPGRNLGSRMVANRNIMSLSKAEQLLHGANVMSR